MIVINFFGPSCSGKTALETKTTPPMCDEIWNGRRCSGYCSVSEHCPYYKKG